MFKKSFIKSYLNEKFFTLIFSDSEGGAAIAVKRFHDILNINSLNSYMMVSEKI